MTAIDTNQELLLGFIDESLDALAGIDSLFVKLENAPSDTEIVNAVFRPIHSLKGNAAYFGLMKIKKLSHIMENLLDSIRKCRRLADRTTIDLLLPGVDLLRAMLVAVRDGHAENSDETHYRTVCEAIDAALKSDTGSAPLERLPEARPQQAVQNESAEPKTRHDKTMRIPEQTLDDFLRCVGELLGVEEMLRNVSRQVGSGADTFAVARSLKGAVDHFEEISRELRTKIMEVRKVEARLLLQKTPRIVRDISVQSGKKIQVVCIGEELLIDKSYVDLLDAPLTHMVRNAADHGVEAPAVRIAAGKPETGKITVTLRENADNLELIIQDDGAGLNYEGLRKKAIVLGLAVREAQLSQSDIVDLLFQSGVSTAETVTDVSGRGVGMDVVKRAVVGAGGTIEVTSTPGAGTTFVVSVPRNASTQIIDGYMVRSSSLDVYVLPLAFVVEAFKIQPEEITGIPGAGSVITRRGSVFPVHSLDTLLDREDSSRNDSTETVDMGVLVDIRGRKSVISVNEIIGIQKVVCKPVEGALLDNALFDGAAISGDGHVSMIINMEKMLQIQ
jgi:two-component system chemotaxis sensor kinase CheA